MNKIFEKIDVVCALRWAGVILLALYVLQAFVNAGRGAEWDDMLKLFVLTLANGLFQPLVLLGLAEGLVRIGHK